MAVYPSPSVTLRIRGPLERADLPGLFERTCALLQGVEPDVLICELVGVAPDAVAMDALARLALAARRSGCHVRLCGPCDELLELARFLGLAAVLGAPMPPAAAEGRTAGRSSRSPGRT